MFIFPFNQSWMPLQNLDINPNSDYTSENLSLLIGENEDYLRNVLAPALNEANGEKNAAATHRSNVETVWVNCKKDWGVGVVDKESRCLCQMYGIEKSGTWTKSRNAFLSSVRNNVTITINAYNTAKGNYDRQVSKIASLKAEYQTTLAQEQQLQSQSLGYEAEKHGAQETYAQQQAKTRQAEAEALLAEKKAKQKTGLIIGASVFLVLLLLGLIFLLKGKKKKKIA